MFKVFNLKIKNSDKEYFDRIFLEAKWLYNQIVSCSDVLKFDTKAKSVKLFVDNQIAFREIKFLSSQMRQGIKNRIVESIFTLAKNKSRGIKIGKLRFKRVVNSIPLTNQTFKIEGDWVRLQPASGKGKTKKKDQKWFHIRGINQLPENPDIRSANLVRKPSGIYLHICIEIEDEEKPCTAASFGMDFGIATPFVLSDGSEIHFNAEAELEAIRKDHKALSRKVKGSKNWIKAKNQLAKRYEHLNNIKADASNKFVAALNDFQIVFQDEMIAGWQKGRFGRQVQNSILGRVKAKLSKSSANLMLERRLPTTQTCRFCGRLNKHELSQRTYSCECGHKQDRDTHSACNMLWFAGLEQASVERESDLRRVLSSIQCKHLSVKQEADGGKPDAVHVQHGCDFN